MAASLGLLLAAALVPAHAACTLQKMEIPVRIVDQRPVASVKLNGTEVPLLVDSGAFFSFISAATATQLNLTLRNLPPGLRVQGYTGRVEVKRTRVERMELLGAVVPNIEFLVGGNELSAGIMGIMGRNILAIADTEYDLAHGVVRLFFPKGECGKVNFAYWAGEAPVVVVPLSTEHREDTAVRVEVRVNGKTMRALLDTGAPDTALTLAAARRAGIQVAELQPHGRVGGAGEGRVKSWTGRVASFELGGEKITNHRLRIDDADMADQEMVLGLDYFLSHRIYVSRLQDQVYLTWNGGAVFAHNRDSNAVHDPRYAALPQAVSNDDADALARRGAAAIAGGHFARALEDLDRAVQLAPGAAGHFFARAQAQLGLRQPRAALADLDEALRLDATLSDARLRRAFLRGSLGDAPGALADLAQLDATSAPSAALRADMGNLYARLQRPPEALRQFDLWVGTHPKDARLAQVLNSRCWLRARLNLELPQALQDCKDAVDKDEGAAAHRDSLGWVYLRVGDAARAKRAFDGAIELEPRAFSLFGRGLAKLRLNDAPGAERDLAEARTLRPRIDDEVLKEGFEFAAEAAAPKSAVP